MEVSKRKSLRKRMRDLKRTLDRTEDAEIVQKKQEKLNDLKAMRKLVLKTTNLYGRYKAIRFFGILHLERRKLERQLKKAQKSTESTPESLSKLQQIQADLSYVKNYPINYKYVSLFSEPTELTVKYREMMRKHIQKSLARKAVYREKVLEEEEKEEVKEDVQEDPFFAEGDEQGKTLFEEELHAEDIEDMGENDAFPAQKRPRYQSKPVKSEGNRTHIRF